MKGYNAVCAEVLVPWAIAAQCFVSEPALPTQEDLQNNQTVLEQLADVLAFVASFFKSHHDTNYERNPSSLVGFHVVWVSGFICL